MSQATTTTTAFNSQKKVKPDLKNITCFQYETKLVDSSIPQKYIESIFNPAMDGNCGFHCIAKEIHNDTNKWAVVKQEMLDHVNANLKFYTDLLGKQDLQHAIRVLVCRDEEVLPSFYFCSPEHNRIVAETYKRTLVFLSNQEKKTYVPYLSEPVKRVPIFLQLSSAHFYLVKLKEAARFNRFLPELFPGHKAYCQKNNLQDWSPVYF